MLINGNSLMKDGNCKGGLTKTVSVSGAGIKEVDKELQGLLP